MTHMANWTRQTARLNRKAKPPTPEQAVQKAVVQALRAWRVGHVIRVNTGAAWVGEHQERLVRFGEVGHSDLLVELPDGRNAYIEIKAPGGKATPAQEAFLARQIARGCPAGVIHSLTELEAFLAQHGLRGTA